MSEKSKVPLDRKLVQSILNERGLDLAQASIREMVLLVAELERKTGVRFLRMEFGIPGLSPNPVYRNTELKALVSDRIVATYPPVAGIPDLKEAGARFVKAFLNVDVTPEVVIPTVGSMQGGFLAQAVTGRRDERKDHILFIDPCFSVHRMQQRFLGLKEVSVDLYDRKNWLGNVESQLKKGNIAAILYSTPNNPTWNILTEEELKRLGQLCTEYDAIAIEDSAYLGMDSRHDYSQPFKPPFSPSVVHHTDRYILLISASKIFSYAGQRVAIAILSPKLADMKFPSLKKHFKYERFLDAFVMSGVYCTTSGVSAVPQYGLAALLNAASDGRLNYVAETKEYAERAKVLRKVMTENGFHLVYDTDLDEPLSDGFFFTFAYPGMSGGELVQELLYYGISCTTLTIAHSCRPEAVRACVSLIGKEDFGLFEERIRAFRRDHARN